MKINYKLKELTENIFLLSVEDSYDLAMTFCRVQEFYESPFSEIRNKKFSLLKFIKLYTLRQGDGVFSYPADWVGFNIPGTVIDKLFKVGFDDWNTYDLVINSAHNLINKKIPKKNKYYLIGAKKDDKETIDHEMCHAFFALNKEYKKVALNNINMLHISTRNKFKKILIKLGYTHQVIDDEIQAYMSTNCNMEHDLKLKGKQLNNFKKVSKALKNNFNKYKQCC